MATAKKAYEDALADHEEAQLLKRPQLEEIRSRVDETLEAARNAKYAASEAESDAHSKLFFIDKMI